MRLATIGFAIIVALTLVMMYDSMAETTTIIMPDGSIVQCTTDSTGITVCI